MSESSSSPPPPAQKAAGKRKAGGTGKKGKTFMEDKTDLLSLVSGITTSKAAQAQSKVDKLKPHIKPAPPPKTGGNKTAAGGKGAKPMRAFGGAVAAGEEKKKSTAGEVKRAEKEKALADAKAAILEKRRAKKARKHEREGAGGVVPVEGVKATKPAKRVGFA